MLATPTRPRRDADRDRLAEDADRDHLAEEAAGWVARLQSSDATDKDKADFQHWLAAGSGRQALYEEFSTLWGDLGSVPIPKDRLKALPRARRVKVASVSGVLLVLGLSAALVDLGFVDRLRADHATSIGEVRTVLLEDGTRATLNTDTAILVRYSERTRRIELLRGEAYFAVAPNRERPFVVDDAILSATALGTRYSVRHAGSPGPGDVRVEEGTVEVRTADAVERLGPGDVATVEAGGGLSIRHADVAAETAWREGKLVFSDRPLAEVLETIGHYRSAPILVVDDAAAERRVSGIFDLSDTDGALAIIEESLPVRVTRLPMMVVVRSR